MDRVAAQIRLMNIFFLIILCLFDFTNMNYSYKIKHFFRCEKKIGRLQPCNLPIFMWSKKLGLYFLVPSTPRVISRVMVRVAADAALFATFDAALLVVVRDFLPETLFEM